MSNTLDTDVLAGLLTRKRKVLLHLRELTMRQPALIAADDMPTLLRIFTAKQQLLEEVQRLDAQLEPFRRQQPEERQWSSTEVRDQCRAAADDCRRLVEELKTTELRDRRDLSERREATSMQLENAHAAAAARTAYQPAVASVGLDLSSDS